MLPPVFVVQIPLDRLLDTGIKVVFRLPAKLRLDLGRIDCISSVMARAVFYVFDQRFRFVQSFQDGLYYLKVCSLIVSANVVNLAYFTFMDNQVDFFAMSDTCSQSLTFSPFPYTGSSSSASARLIISGISFSGK